MRYLVRVEGSPNKRITIGVPPNHIDFLRQYKLARVGINPLSDRAATLRNTGDIEAEIKTSLKRAQQRAQLKGHVFKLTIEEVYGILERQRFSCAISGLEFDLSPKASQARRPFSMSLDRVDNAIGYTIENVRLVVIIANIARSDWTDEDLFKLCRAVTDKQK